MKKKKTYFDFLSDPRWQQKKTEILQRDNFTCQHCGRQDRTLHVHHLLYNKDANRGNMIINILLLSVRYVMKTIQKNQENLMHYF